MKQQWPPWILAAVARDMRDRRLDPAPPSFLKRKLTTWLRRGLRNIKGAFEKIHMHRVKLTKACAINGVHHSAGELVSVNAQQLQDLIAANRVVPPQPKTENDAGALCRAEIAHGAADWLERQRVAKPAA